MSARIGLHASALTVIAAALAASTVVVIAADPAQNSAPTIGDLVRKAPVTVQKNTAAAADSAKAMENYKRFLDLQRTDPKLRAEAMRRLGDLNQDSDQMDKDPSQVDQNSVEAIRLYTVLLKAYPDYARNDQVLYQMARAYEEQYVVPCRCISSTRRLAQANPALPPLVELGHDIFGDEHSMSGATDQLVFFGLTLGRHQRQNRAAVWRCDRHPSAT